MFKQPMTPAFLGAILGGLTVAMGAFGAHALDARLTPDDLAIYDTAVQYMGFHALALLALQGLGAVLPRVAVRPVTVLWFLGVVIFTGSLVLLVLTGPRWLGAITPIGGTLLILGWAWLAASLWRGSNQYKR